MSTTGPSTRAQALGPVQPAERIEVIDILRGFALLGILLVNMEMFSNPLQVIVMPRDPSMGLVDRVADWLVRFFAEGKFYSLFSFLFGLGFSIQLVRAEEHEVRFLPVYVRRLLALLLIGLIHASLIWIGDILTLYALLGFLLILFRKAKPRTLLIWGIVLLTAPLLLNSLSVVAIEVGRTAGPHVAVQIDRSFAIQDSTLRVNLERANSAYSNGDFAEITGQRVRDASFAAFGYLFMGPSALAMFLIGLYFGRRGVFRHIEENLRFFRRLLWWGLSIGVVGNLIFATLIPWLWRTHPSPILLLAMCGQAVGAPALCLFYVSALTLISRRDAWKGKLKGLAAVGRIPLSNYLMQSLLCTVIFYGYGLGLFGQVGKAWGLVLATVIYVALLGISVWWVQRFVFGPAEWLWRSVTYRRFQPLRLGRDSNTRDQGGVVP